MKIKIWLKINMSNEINTLDLFSWFEAEKNHDLAKRGTAPEKKGKKNEDFRVFL